MTLSWHRYAETAICAKGRKGFYYISRSLDAWHVTFIPFGFMKKPVRWFRDTLEAAMASAQEKDDE